MSSTELTIGNAIATRITNKFTLASINNASKVGDATSSLLKTQARYKSLTVAIQLFLGVGIVSLLSQISLPFPGSPVPITGQTLGVIFVGGLFGAQIGTSSIFSYLLLGGMGLPFFAGGVGGWKHIFGASGGYLIAFAFATLVLGYAANKGWDRSLKTWLPMILLAEIIIYGIGVPWLMISQHYSLARAISEGFTPFIIGDIVKTGIATTTLPIVWKFFQDKNK